MICWCMYLLRKCVYRDIQHIILKHTAQATMWYQNYLHMQERKKRKVMVVRNVVKNIWDFGGSDLYPPSPLGKKSWKALNL